MGSETELEVFRQFTNTQEKYDYFLMTFAAAAIAFAVHQTRGMTLDRYMIILGIAVVLWAISFLAGCRRRQFIGSNMYNNMDLLRVLNGTHPLTGLHPQKIEIASEQIYKNMEINSKRASFWANVQLYSFILGAIIFVIWHVIDLAVTSPGLTTN